MAAAWLRADEVVERWQQRAVARGLDAGPSALPPSLASRADRRGLFDRPATERILDELEGATRRRRARWQIRQLATGIALVHDPLGAGSSIRVPAELRHLAELERQAVILDDVERSIAADADLSLDRLAVRWSIGLRTLTRWRAEVRHSRPGMAQSAPESSTRLSA
jgi:hypothetical protein